MNISNELKNKVINGINISNYELDIFMGYVIDMAKFISSYMMDVYDYTVINLCNEILWSYNLDSCIYKGNDRYFCVFSINNRNYLLDIDFDSDKLDFLMKHKYMVLDDRVYKLYLEIVGGM